MTGVVAPRSLSTRLLSPQNASLFRLATRSIRRDPKRSLAVAALAGAPIGLLTSFVFGMLFRVSFFDARFDDSFVVTIAAFVPLIVGTVIVAAFTASIRLRTRELGQLVVVGADRSQIGRLVLIEAAAIVVPGALLFSVLGMALAFVRQPNDESLRSVLGQGRSFILLAPLLFGLCLTLLAALLPAGRAASVSPIAALNARVPEVKQRRWPVLLAVGLAVGVALWRTRIAPWDSNAIFFWGVVAVWAGFALLATLVPRAIRLMSLYADRLPGVARLVVRDSGRSVARSSSLAIVALAVSLLGVMAVAGLESDRGVYQAADARYITTPLNGDLVAADAAVAGLGSVAAIVDFDDLRQLERTSPGYGPTFVAALTDEAIVAFGLTDEQVVSIPESGAIVLDGNDWPLMSVEGDVIPTVVVDAGVGQQTGLGGELPVALMRAADVAALPYFFGSEGMAAEEIAERAAMFNPAVRLYVADEPLTASIIDDVRFGRVATGASLGVASPDDRYFGLGLDEFLSLLLAISLGVVVLAAVGLTKLGAKEVDAQLRPMLDMGAAPSIRRRFLALQTGALVVIGGLLGSGLGVLLFWVVTRGDRSVPDPIVPWSAMLVLSAGAALLSAGAVAVLFGPNPLRTAESRAQE